MGEFNMPVALEELAQSARPKSMQAEPELPPSLLEKAAKVRADGGISALNDLFTRLPDLYSQNKQALDEVSPHFCLCFVSGPKHNCTALIFLKKIN